MLALTGKYDEWTMAQVGDNLRGVATRSGNLVDAIPILALGGKK